MTFVSFEHNGTASVMQPVDANASDEAIAKDVARIVGKPVSWQRITHDEYRDIRANRPHPVAVASANTNTNAAIATLAAAVEHLDAKIAHLDKRLEAVIDAAYVTEIEGVE